MFIVIAIAAVLFGGFAHYRYKQEKARTETLFTYATGRGWSFSVNDNSLADRWAGMPFGMGDHRRCHNVISGTHQSRTFTAFDYSYQTHSRNQNGGESTETHRFAVCVIGIPGYLPELQVAPETMFSRFGHALGASDIDLESEDFNRAYRVRCRDPKFASDVLTPRTMELLIARSGTSMRIEGQVIIGWASGELSISGLEFSLSTLGGVVDGIPSFVWHDNGVPVAGTANPGEVSST